MTRRFAVDPRAGTMDVACGWCGQPTRAWSETMCQGSVYVCRCGAMGLFAPPHDFDEAAEELLDQLHLEGTVAEPARPVGSSGLLSARAYDAVAARRRLAEILAASGSETRAEDAETAFTSPLSGAVHVMNSWGLWWRPGAT